MRKYFKIVVVLFIVGFTLGIFFDSDVIEANTSHSKGAPIHHCIQCCPNHNLAPTSISQTKISPTAVFNQFFPEESSFYSALFADSIFHPPRV